MEEERRSRQTLWVPDHYPEFRCKCGECRTPCCSGWGISISMKDYFRILGMDCSAELRECLDTAMSVLPDSTEERYAIMDPDWTGRCKLQRKSDGYCMLQCECGESAIPEVCRRYPREYRCGEIYEAALANSCEHTVELLMADTAPVTMVEIPVPEDFADVEKKNRLRFEGADDPALAPEYRRMREESIRLLNRREKTLEERIGDVLHYVSGGTEAAEAGPADEVLTAAETDDTVRASAEIEAARAVLMLIAVLAADSASLEEETERVFEILHVRISAGGNEIRTGGIAFDEETYIARRERFSRAMPGWEILFEKLLVNHVAFSGFPYAPRMENLEKMGIALAASYALMKFMNVCLMTEGDGSENGGGKDEAADGQRVVDLNAAIFRLIEHSGFSWNAPIVLARCGIRTAEAASEFVKRI